MPIENLRGFKIFRFSGLKKEKNVFCCVLTKFYKKQPILDMSAGKLKNNILFKKFLRENGVKNYFFPIQRHTSNIFFPDDNKIKTAEGFDAAMTFQKRKALLSFSADCSTAIFYDKKNKVFALCHAGWKGLLLNIYSAVFKNMVLRYQTQKENLFVGIGPFISEKNYPIDEEVAHKFDLAYGKKALKFYSRKKGKTYLSLKNIINFQLDELGLKNREFADICTYDNDLFYSYRKKEDKRFAMLAFLK